MLTIQLVNKEHLVNKLNSEHFSFHQQKSIFFQKNSRFSKKFKILKKIYIFKKIYIYFLKKTYFHKISKYSKNTIQYLKWVRFFFRIQVSDTLAKFPLVKSVAVIKVIKVKKVINRDYETLKHIDFKISKVLQWYLRI